MSGAPRSGQGVMAEAKELIDIPLFGRLGWQEREYLAAALTPRVVPPLETVFRVGDVGQELFIVQEGTVEILAADENGREVRLGVLRGGDFFGEISLLDGGPRTATARTAERTTLLVLGRKDFERCVTRFPPVALKILEVISSRQRHTVDKLRGVEDTNEVIGARLTARQRVAERIGELVASPASIAVHAAALTAWVLLNGVGLRGPRAIDPFPFYGLMLWWAVEGLFLLLLAQARFSLAAKKLSVANELEYQRALRVQVEMSHICQRLDEQAACMKEREGEGVTR